MHASRAGPHHDPPIDRSGRGIAGISGHRTIPLTRMIPLARRRQRSGKGEKADVKDEVTGPEWIRGIVEDLFPNQNTLRTGQQKAVRLCQACGNEQEEMGVPVSAGAEKD